MPNKKVIVVSFCCLLALAGCQWFASDTNEPAPSEERPPDDDDPPALTPTVKQKVVTLGFEGYEEEVTMQPYATEWIKLEYDSRLKVTEEEGFLLFQHPEDQASFKVYLVENGEVISQYQHAVLEQGYELYNMFEVENGEGFIYYLYDARDQLELYYIEENEQAIIVLLQFAEPVADRYQFIFDYMLGSITFPGKQTKS
ncbi:hypothetical protein CathTA2_0927 [Caldalkalibacillus thermarum TA2.A1]|uniref:Lipoprotein n=1 Tax=Caldalkalibacillus thermarum (strain TA2.A1) TaxID=986075 RepID=F5L564_CALTT|nr:hypothetical protein [Caldalkalibacillus thermarum]EGL83531.1 hypothetical protein CathTA2_0927 [Caldalkalibacillus thermarum TA2.A1]QZT32529.1 hypothetical protein HUR95_08900 [Caldalkalibacillus thermarum TA2.A1]